MEAVNSLTEIGSITSGKEEAKPDSNILGILAKNYCTSEPFKVTQEEKLIEPGMMGHVCIPLSWKQFVYRRGRSFDLNSILGDGLVAGWREGRETQTYSILHTSKPIGCRRGRREIL